MGSVVRYNFVKNDTGVVFTPATFPVQSDGDDKQFKVVKRWVTAIDIGTGNNQLGKTAGANAGLIMQVIPDTYNVLWAWAFAQSPNTAQNGMVPYQMSDGDITPIPTPTAQAQLMVGFSPADSTLRIIDKSQGGIAAIAANTILTIIYILGQRMDSRDVMNY